MLTLSCLMASCGSSEPTEPADRSAVRFDNEALSRTTLTTSDNLTDRPFAVYADMQRIDSPDDDKFVTVCDGLEVRYDASEKEWTYDDTRYWFPQFQYSFIAMHPANASGVTNPKISNNQLKFKYRQPSDYKRADDILLAVHRRNYTGGPTYPVRFRFEHLLSNIDVSVTYTDPDSEAAAIQVQDITIYDIPTQAEYAVTPAQLSPNAQMTSDYAVNPESIDGWNITNYGTVKTKFVSTNKAATIPNDNTPHSLFSAGDALLLLPNPEEETEMEISYAVVDAKGNAGPIQTETAVIPNGWLPGRRYLLSMLIVKGIVQFTVDVTEWEYTDPIETIVPRK